MMINRSLSTAEELVFETLCISKISQVKIHGWKLPSMWETCLFQPMTALL